MSLIINNERIRNSIETIKNIDDEKLIRESLDDLSLDSRARLTLNRIKIKLNLVSTLDGEYVNSEHLNAFEGQIKALADLIKMQAERDNHDFVLKRRDFSSELESRYNDFLKIWPPFITAAVEQNKLLLSDQQGFISDLQKQGQQIQEQISKSITDAEKYAKDIENRARETAKGISIQTAQDQFELAQQEHNKQVVRWGWLSIASIVVFIAVAFWFYQAQLSGTLQWLMLYYTAIRLTILTAIGAVATFCLRVLRAHMHMYQHSLHRQRLANSIAAFVESATSNEQRDLILSRLVDAVASFGTSGLLQNNDDTISPQRMIIDNINRSFSSPPKSP